YRARSAATAAARLFAIGRRARVVTQRVAITGWPVSHSRSPLIHGYWLKLHGVDGSYDRIAVVPDEAATFYRNLAASGLVGCNVTVPHKEVAAGVCDDL